jgi:hypothetical protein
VSAIAFGILFLLSNQEGQENHADSAAEIPYESEINAVGIIPRRNTKTRLSEATLWEGLDRARAIATTLIELPTPRY